MFLFTGELMRRKAFPLSVVSAALRLSEFGFSYSDLQAFQQQVHALKTDYD